MHIELQQGENRGLALGAIYGAAGIVVCGLFMLWQHLGLPQPICYFHAVTGIPCPMCGTTRMLETLLHGQVIEAFGWNPLFFIGLLAITFWAVVSTTRSLFHLPVWRLVPDDRERLVFRLTVVVLIAGNWGYLIWRGI